MPCACSEHRQSTDSREGVQSGKDTTSDFPCGCTLGLGTTYEIVELAVKGFKGEGLPFPGKLS